MVTLVRPRIAALVLSMDAGGDPCCSDLTLTTRDGEVVRRGEVGPDAWLAGLRLRRRCQGTWQDAYWLMTRMLLETELAAHGLGRDGGPDLDVRITPAPDGVTLTTTCRVIPAVRNPLRAYRTLGDISRGVSPADGALSTPAGASALRARQGAGTG